MIDYPNRQQFIAAFGDGAGFSGVVTDSPDDPEGEGMEGFLGRKSWTEVPYDHLRMLQSSLGWLTRDALRHFLPAYFFEAMSDLNGEDLDYTMLAFMAGDPSALLDLDYSHEQLALLLDVVDYIKAHSEERFDGLDASLANHRRQLARMSTRE